MTAKAEYTSKRANHLAKELRLPCSRVRLALGIPDPAGVDLEERLGELNKAQTPQEILRFLDDPSHPLITEGDRVIQWEAVKKLTPLLEDRLAEARTFEEAWELLPLAPRGSEVKEQILERSFELVVARTERQADQICQLHKVLIEVSEKSDTYCQALVHLIAILEDRLDWAKTFPQVCRVLDDIPILTCKVRRLALERAVDLAKTFEQVYKVLWKYQPPFDSRAGKQALDKGRELAENLREYKQLLNESPAGSQFQRELICQLAKLI